MTITENSLKGQLLIKGKTKRKGHFARLGIAYQHDCSTFLGNMNGLTGSYFHSSSLYYQVDTLPLCQPAYFFLHICIHGIYHTCSPQLHGLVQTLLHDVNHIYPGYPFGLQSHHGNQSDTAGTKHHRCLSGMYPALIGCMKSYRQRFYQSPLQCIHILGQLKT